MLILDTHVWIWLVNGDSDLDPAARQAIETEASRGAVLVPAISVWEVAMLESKGRIVLAMPCARWVEAALTAPGLDLSPLTPEVAVESVYLPGDFHDDPADRMIVATTRLADATVATRDRRILDYATLGHVKALAA